MHMWMWFGYDLGDFLFPSLTIDTRWAFALTWIVLFFVALLFEASKVYLARVQREAQRRLYPYRSDERRNLLWDREHTGPMEPTTSRNGTTGPDNRWSSLRTRVLVNSHQTLVFIVHNVVGYLLMLAVMVYNVHLLLAVVFGMMLGYFLFGTKLTQFQMQCFRTKRVVICTPECDDTAETSTPPLLDSSTEESDFFICRTRTCIQPSHYFPANSNANGESSATCYYGAKKCPSRVARAKKAQPVPSNTDASVEDAQLLQNDKQGCCKKKQDTPPVSEARCSSQPVQAEVTVEPQPKGCCKSNKKEEDSNSERESVNVNVREDSPQITCCHSKNVTTESREQILQ